MAGMQRVTFDSIGWYYIMGEVRYWNRTTSIGIEAPVSLDTELSAFRSKI